MSGVRSLLVTLGLIWIAAGAASAQQVHLPPMISQSPSMGNIPVTTDDPAQRRLAVAANQQRLEEIKRDMEKMSQLTEELKQCLTTSGQGIMSVDAIKKTQQIEKLAHSMRSKMKLVL